MRELNTAFRGTPFNLFFSAPGTCPTVVIRKSAIRAYSNTDTLKDLNLGQVPGGAPNQKNKTFWGPQVTIKCAMTPVEGKRGRGRGWRGAVRGYGVRCTVHGVRGRGCGVRVRGAGCGVWVRGHGVRGTGCGVQGTKKNMMYSQLSREGASLFHRLSCSHVVSLFVRLTCSLFFCSALFKQQSSTRVIVTMSTADESTAETCKDSLTGTSCSDRGFRIARRHVVT